MVDKKAPATVYCSRIETHPEVEGLLTHTSEKFRHFLDNPIAYLRELDRQLIDAFDRDQLTFVAPRLWVQSMRKLTDEGPFVCNHPDSRIKTVSLLDIFINGEIGLYYCSQGKQNGELSFISELAEADVIRRAFFEYIAGLEQSDGATMHVDHLRASVYMWLVADKSAFNEWYREEKAHGAVDLTYFSYRLNALTKGMENLMTIVKAMTVITEAVETHP